MTAFSYEKNDALWDVLRRNPGGISAKAAAVTLKWSATYASARLGKLALYDVISRVPHPTERGYRYQMKPRIAHA